MIRTLLVASFLLLPGVTLAAEASVNSLQSAGAAGISTQTSGILQPASVSNGSSLQSAGSGTAQSTTDQSAVLQQTQSSDAAKLLIQGEGEAPHETTEKVNLDWLLYIAVILVVTTAATSGAWLYQQRTIQQNS